MRMFAAAALLALSASVAAAAEPAIRNLDVRGMQIGAATKIVIDGDNLGPDTRLLLPFDAAQELAADATDTRLTFQVTPAEGTTPGIYNLRVATAKGASAPFLVGVDRLPQSPWKENIDALPAALHGALGGSTILQTRFTGLAGQEVTIEVEARRLGGGLRPVLHLYDSQKLQLAWSWPTPALFGDTRLTLKLPADGEYTVALHDAEYAAPGPNHFRLKIGEWTYADQVYPPVVERGQAVAVELVGRGPWGPTPAAPIANDPWLAVAWPDPGQASGVRPTVGVSDLPEFVEEPGGPAIQQLPPAPLAVSGRLLRPDEEDLYWLPVTPGAKVRFEVFSERLGSTLDAVLLLRDRQGAQLARGEDGPSTTDPVLEFTPAENTTAVLLAIGDLHRRGGERSVYRIVVEPASTAPAPRDVRLTLTADRFRVSRSGPTVFPIFAERRGYVGPIRLFFEGLPAEIAVAGNNIPAGSEGALVMLTAAGEASGSSLVSLHGETIDGTAPHTATIPTHPLATLQPWLSAELAASFTAPSNFSVDWGELATAPDLVLAGKAPLPLRFTRPAGDSTPVRFTLLTNQRVPMNNGQPDAAKTVRFEAAVEAPADKSDAQVVVLTPPDLVGQHCDLSIQAELLSADKQRVLETAFTPVRRLKVVNPLVLHLPETRLQASLAPAGGTVKLAGKIERRAGFAGDVVVSLAGLPGGVKGDPVTVKPDVADFELAVVFPAGFQPQEVRGLKLSATGPPDPQQPTVQVRSNEIEVAITLVAAPAGGG